MNKKESKLIILITLIIIIIPYKIDAKNKMLLSETQNITSIDNIETSLNSFYHSLEKQDEFILNTNKFNCNENGCIESSYLNIGLITTFEYKKIGENTSYLKNNNSYYTLNENSIDNIKNDKIESADNSTNSGIRASIYLQSDVQVIGSGKSNDPFILVEKGDIKINYLLPTGEIKETFPSVNDPYIIDKIKCTNSTHGYFEEDTETIKLTEINLPTTCTVIFKKGYKVSVVGKNIDITAPASKTIGRVGETSFEVSAKTGYTLKNPIINCTNNAIGKIENSNIKITNITSDTECNVDVEKE